MFCKYSCYMSDEIILFNMEIAKRSGLCDEDVKILLCCVVHLICTYGKCQVEISKIFFKENKIEFYFLYFICRMDFMWERPV